jgi:thiol:disulfide interchange protein
MQQQHRKTTTSNRAHQSSHNSKSTGSHIKSKNLDEFESYVGKFSTAANNNTGNGKQVHHHHHRHVESKKDSKTSVTSPTTILTSLPEDYAEQKVLKITDKICFEAAQCVKPEQALRNHIYNNRQLRAEVRTLLFDFVSDVEQFISDKIQNTPSPGDLNHQQQSSSNNLENEKIKRENQELKNQILAYTKELERCDHLVALVQESHKSLIKSNEVLLEELSYYQQHREHDDSDEDEVDNEEDVDEF